MRILMFGPAYGHNILPFLQFFQKNREHELTLVSPRDRRNRFGPEQFDRIRFLHLDNSVLRGMDYLRFLRVLRHECDLIWLHGGYNYLLLAYVALFRARRHTYLNINIWGESVPRQAGKKNLKGALYRTCLRSADCVQCNWYGTGNLVTTNVPGAPVEIRFWGLPKECFEEEVEKEPSPAVRESTASIPEGVFRFFFPKALLPVNRHDIVIEAARILHERGHNQFVVIFWGGNELDTTLFEKYTRQAEAGGVTSIIRMIVKHPFLSNSEMAELWRTMDAGLCIGDQDQLSTTFLEPQLYERELIASDIEPYRIFNEKFNAGLRLVKNEPTALAAAMEGILTGKACTPAELKRQRSRTLHKNYNFTANLEQHVKDFEKQRLAVKRDR